MDRTRPNVGHRLGLLRIHHTATCVRRHGPTYQGPSLYVEGRLPICRPRPALVTSMPDAGCVMWSRREVAPVSTGAFFHAPVLSIALSAQCHICLCFLFSLFDLSSTSPGSLLDDETSMPGSELYPVSALSLSFYLCLPELRCFAFSSIFRSQDRD